MSTKQGFWCVRFDGKFDSRSRYSISRFYSEVDSSYLFEMSWSIRSRLKSAFWLIGELSISAILICLTSHLIYNKSNLNLIYKVEFLYFK
jgi:hypothetical protein